MTNQVKSKGDTEDEIMVAVNNKVEEWKVRDNSIFTVYMGVYCIYWYIYGHCLYLYVEVVSIYMLKLSLFVC